MFSDEVDWAYQTGQTGHRALERLGDLLLDVLRARARIGRVHDRRRNLHGRHQRERQGRKSCKKPNTMTMRYKRMVITLLTIKVAATFIGP